MDQIEFEEWSLKGLDKQLGPKVLNSSNTKDESNIVCYNYFILPFDLLSLLSATRDSLYSYCLN